MANSAPVTIASNQSALPTTPTGDVASGATDSGNPIKVGGRYNATLPNLTDGQRGDLQLNGKGGVIIGGSTVPSGFADSGYPVKIGGVHNSTLPTFTDGLRGDIQIGTRGSLSTTLMVQNSTSPIQVALTNADGIAASSVATRLEVVSRQTIFNGSTYDRAYSIINATNSIGTGISAAGMVAQVDDTSPTSITENQFGNVRMSADHSLLTAERSTTPTQTSVSASASSVSILAANSARKGATVTNDSSAVMYLKLGATASTTSYTVTLAGAAAAPFGYYEVPFGYVGAIDAIWGSATGNARVTELA